MCKIAEIASAARTLLAVRSALVTAEQRRVKKVAWMKRVRAEARAYGIPTRTKNLCVAVRSERERRFARTVRREHIQSSYSGMGLTSAEVGMWS